MELIDEIILPSGFHLKTNFDYDILEFFTGVSENINETLALILTNEEDAVLWMITLEGGSIIDIICKLHSRYLVVVKINIAIWYVHEK